jgi:hypothetical protein
MVKVNASTASTYNISKDTCGWSQTGSTGQVNYYVIGSVNVTGAVTLGYIIPSKKSSVIYISTSAGVSSVYLSTNSTATSGKSSGTSFEYGIVYGFAKMSASNYHTYNIPSSWHYVTYSGGYYYYRVGSIQADGSTSRTLSYTAATAMTKLSAPSASVKISGTNYVAEIHNNASVSVTANITWYNASTGAYLSSTTASPGPNGTSTVTLPTSTANSVYVSVYVSASSYLTSETIKSTTCSLPKLSAPQLVETDFSDNRSDTTSPYPYTYSLTVKNTNSVEVDLKYCFDDGD